MAVPRTADKHAYYSDSLLLDGVVTFDRSAWPTGVFFDAPTDPTFHDILIDWVAPGDVVLEIIGSGHADTIYADQYDDTVKGGGGKDKLYGLDGDDLIAGDYDDSETEGASDTIDGGAGDDALFGGGGDDSLLGGDGDDSLVGNDGNDSMAGGAGADVMAGGKGHDTYQLGSNDTIEEAAGEGTDTVLVLGQSSYTVQANIENATYMFGGNGKLIGNALNNALTGGTGADTLSGGEGHDTLSGGGGADSMAGGNGNDRYDVFQAGDKVVELAGGGIDTVVTTLTTYTLGANVENLNALGGAITGTGNALSNAMSGSSGADQLSGLDGNDSINGFSGNDTAWGGNGNDSMQGMWGLDQLRGEAGNDTIYGGDDMDYVYGGDGNDLVDGGNFADVMYGDAGADTMQGGAGNDSLYGGTGNDSMRGGTGNDRIRGNEGADKLYGDSGNDTFVYGKAADSNATTGRDYIYDFVKGSDKIDLALIDANSGTLTNDAFAFVGAAPMFASPGELTIQEGLIGSIVNGDLNGDGLYELSLVVVGVTGLTASDFIL
jgi:Ca2+-binding RTX toxin-like protein